MINWTDITSIVLPMTQHITDEDLKKYMSNAIEPSCQMQSIDFLCLSCHTQAIERVIKFVTESSLSACGPEARDGVVKAEIVLHKMMSKFEIKKTFYLRVKKS